jgi:4-alpha-glucanotransferase
MYVAQFAMEPGSRPFGCVPPASVASVNTHDLPPFASYWEGLAIERRLRWGHLTAGQAADARAQLAQTRRDVVAYLRAGGRMSGDASTGEALHGILRELAASDATTMLVGLEDLWLETESQNVPGTADEQPNWRRKARYAVGELSGLSGAAGVLRQVDALRREETP